MSDAAEAIDELPAQPVKDLYEIGEIPPLGHVPKNMYAWAIRRERHGERGRHRGGAQQGQEVARHRGKRRVVRHSRGRR